MAPPWFFWSFGMYLTLNNPSFHGELGVILSQWCGAHWTPHSGAVVQWHSSLGRKGARHCPLAVGPTKGPLLHPPDQVLLGAAVGLSLDHSQTCEWQQYQHKYVNGSSEVVMVAVNRMPL